MSRLPRMRMSATFFHILVQGINKSFIFNTPKEMEKYLFFISKYKKDYFINIIAYCIMNNHAHLLVEVKNIEDLSSFMHKINTNYAIYYNKKHDRVGYVFRNRYKSQEICNERYLYNCIAYIHNNPVKAKICKNAEEYKFSSCNEFTKKEIIEYKKHEEIEDELEFLEIEEHKGSDKKCKEIIEKFLRMQKIEDSNLLKEKSKLKELLIILKINNKFSYRKIEKELKIGRETLRKLLKK